MESLTSISDKCYKATAFDGSKDLIPKSQIFGQDYEVTKSEAYWISAWILDKKNIQYSNKKVCWFDEGGNKKPHYEYIKHIPRKINKKVEIDKTVIK